MSFCWAFIQRELIRMNIITNIGIFIYKIFSYVSPAK